MKILLQLNSISKRYGPTEIFCQAAVGFAEDARVGVIGRNGAGKTTLCRLATEEEYADEGTIDKHRDLRISYLKQSDPFNLDETVIEFLHRYTKKEEWKCGKIAGKFNVRNESLNKIPIGDLPGGYRTRVKLTAMLLTEPNFLILDEPTNYLDLNTLLLLEHFLKDYTGAFIIVSHDREFLKRTCKQTLEIENGKMNLFPGKIEEYLEFKADLLENRTRYNQNIEMKQKRLQEFVDRFRAKNTKARQAQSKLKQLKRLDRIEITNPVKTVNINIPQLELRKKGWSLICRDLTVGYSEKTVASGIDLEVRSGSHVAVLGDNGQGKTTFLRTVAGELNALDGEFDWSIGEGVAYYAQHVYQELDPRDDIIKYLSRKAASEVSRQEILNLAGSFLFHGDDIFKTVDVLSGGEKARLCLAGILLSKKQVLLLDEPTNHLDFETVEALGTALNNYNGTIFFVSHDRTFVNMLASEIIDVCDGRIVHYPGNYSDYIHHLEQKVRMDVSPNDNKKEKSSKILNGKSKFKLRKELQAKINKMKKDVKKVENQIAEYEKERNGIMNIFSLKPESYSVGQNKRLDELTKLIEAEEAVWYKLLESLEELNIMQKTRSD